MCVLSCILNPTVVRTDESFPVREGTKTRLCEIHSNIILHMKEAKKKLYTTASMQFIIHVDKNNTPR